MGLRVPIGFCSVVLTVVLGMLMTMAALGGERPRDDYDPPIRDPWAGFPLGSSVTLKSTVNQGERSTSTVTRCQISQLEGPEHPRVSRHILDENGKVKSTSRESHIHGGTPAQLGLKLVSLEHSTTTIDGKKYPCTVGVYENDPEGARADVLVRPMPQIWKDGGPRKPVDTRIRLVLTQVRGLKVPYRELATPGLDIALGPEVVKAEWTLGEKGRTTSFTKRVVRLSDPVVVGKETVDCVCEETSGQEGEGMVTCREWLSDAIPGRSVREVVEGAAGTEKVRSEQVAVDFHVAQPMKLDTDWRKIPLVGRPAVRSTQWGGMHAGCWIVSCRLIVNPNQYVPMADLVSVPASLADGQFVTRSEGLVGWGRSSAPGFEIQPPSSDDDGAEGAGRTLLAIREETIRVAGIDMPCKATSYRANSEFPGSTTTYTFFHPMKEEHRKLLAVPGLAVRRTEEHAYKTSYQDVRSTEVSEVVGLSETFRVGSRELKCCRVRTVSQEISEGTTYPPDTTISLVSADCPRGTVASYRCGTSNGPHHDWNLVVDWGEADREPPREVSGSVLAALRQIGHAPFEDHRFSGVPLGTTLTENVQVFQGGKLAAEATTTAGVTGHNWFGCPEVTEGRLSVDGKEMLLDRKKGTPAWSVGSLCLSCQDETKETLRIGEQDVECLKASFAGKLTEAEKISVTVWRWPGHSELPYREHLMGQLRFAMGRDVLRMDIAVSSPKGTVTSTRAVASLSETARVGERAYAKCVKEKWQTDAVMGDAKVAMKGEELSHPEIPGSRLSCEQTVLRGEEPETVKVNLAGWKTAEVQTSGPGAGGSPYDGFAPGCTLTIRKRPDRNWQKEDYVITKRLVGWLQGGGAIERSESGEYDSLGMPFTGVARMVRLDDLALKESAVGEEETIEIRNQQVACTRRVVDLIGQPVRLTLWTKAGAGGEAPAVELAPYGLVLMPKGTLKYKLSRRSGNVRLTAVRTIADDLVRLKIGGKEYECSREIIEQSTSTGGARADGKLTISRWYGRSIPGYFAKVQGLEPESTSAVSWEVTEIRE